MINTVECLLDRDEQFADNDNKLEDLIYKSIEVQLGQRVEWLHLGYFSYVADGRIADVGFAAG